MLQVFGVGERKCRYSKLKPNERYYAFLSLKFSGPVRKIDQLS